MNHTRVDDYFAAMDAGRFPIERGFHYTPQDLRLTALFQMLQNITVDLDLYAGVFGRDLVDEYRPIWLALEEREWVRIEPRTLTLVGDGVYYTPLIQSLLAADRLEEMRRARLGRS
jgi:oxygen-independent coproporphyrinogen-3 oxidase